MRAKGLGVVVITYDTREIVEYFATRKQITLPVLGDAQSRIIRDFGVLNTAVPEGHMWMGVPYPGTFIVDANGMVKSKYFEDTYQDRFSTPTILLREFGSVAGTRETVVRTDHLEMRYYATRDPIRPNLRFTLVADFEMPEKMHVYTPEVKNYIPIDFQLEPSDKFRARPVDYPQGELLHLEAIDETVPVYEGKFRLTQDVVMASTRSLEEILSGESQITIRGKLRYQACDDKICYLPQTLPMEWTLNVEPLDRQRVPEAIRHK